MSISSFILNKVKSVQSKESHAHNDVLCTVCQIPLTNPLSQEAGKGPICHSRSRFAEKLSRAQLVEVEGKTESVDQGKNTVRSVILRIKGEENPRFVTIAMKDESAVSFWDHSEYDNNYEQGMSAAESILKAWYHVDKDVCDSVAPLVEPKDATLVDSLKDFHSSLREENKTRDKEIQGMSIRKESKKHLDKAQTKIRGDLIKNYRADDNSKFKNKWENGEYPMATFMARLAASELPGAKDLLATLESQYGSVKSKDFGLTDDEISHGFQQATMPLERKLFNAVIKGKSDLLQLSQAYKNVKEKPSPEHFKKLLELTN